MNNINRQITLAARPVGLPKESDFKMVESPAPGCGAGEAVVRNIYLSVDPYMRGRMSDAESYAAPLQIGEVMLGGGVGRVIESSFPGLAPGDIVGGMLGWQDYAVAKGESLRKIDPGLAPISTALGVLGMPGMTAYFGLLDVCHPQAGETVVVSGAAGAVGSLVGQIAKIKSCRAVGIAGSDVKIAYLLKDLGFDAAFNYKTCSDYHNKLKELCPNGIDAYFDNVGGALTDAVISVINVKARIAVCGQISQYNLKRPERGPRWLWLMIVKRAKVEGFMVMDYASRFEEGHRQMAQWLQEGKLKYREDIVQGLENAPQAFIGMLQGRNIGKQLVQINEA
ncbi:MAG: NADP-dependent oxidoreductase [Candidatus Sumerlaeota bacterium]|nr:NADP-dependent oxidoreductase [Candidatus Sumerlaeota bacterium]